MKTEIKSQMFLKVGRHSTPILDIADASRKYQLLRDTADLGASDLPEGKIMEGGKAVARVSYNGRVWPVAPHFSGQKMLLEAV